MFTRASANSTSRKINWLKTDPDNAFVDEVLDRVQIAVNANSKKMFGGYGIFHNGLMFALVADNELYLKADKHSQNFFSELNLEPFTYHKSGKPYKMSYYRAPETFFEDDDETVLWSNRAIEAALRAPRKKK